MKFSEIKKIAATTLVFSGILFANHQNISAYEEMPQTYEVTDLFSSETALPRQSLGFSGSTAGTGFQTPVITARTGFSVTWIESRTNANYAVRIERLNVATGVWSLVSQQSFNSVADRSRSINSPATGTLRVLFQPISVGGHTGVTDIRSGVITPRL
jgi:hypothetical protein